MTVGAKKYCLLILYSLLMQTVSAQYEDTIKGKIFMKYNHPARFKLSLLGGAAFETPTISGGYSQPIFFVEAHARPVVPLLLHGKILYQPNFAWRYQDVKDNTGFEAGLSWFFKNKIKEKPKLFTAGNKWFNYDFFMPVKVGWSLGITGSLNVGSAVFNSGTDNATPILFRKENTTTYKFEKNFAVGYNYRFFTAGFVVSTTTRLKGVVRLPTGVDKARRMKSFTCFKVEFLYGTTSNYDTLIGVVNSNTYAKTNYAVQIPNTKNSGIRFSGIFRRKLIGFKLESGIKPGIPYRFSGGETDSVFDRSYILFGIAFGWM